MTFATSARLVRLAPRLRTGVLVFFALLVAHDAIYLAEFGSGPAFATAMSASGHDGYWIPFSLIVTFAAAGVFLGTIGVLGRLQGGVSADEAVAHGPSYLGELIRTWIRLFPTVAVLFALQENLEHVLAHGRLAGLEPLGGAGYELALPVLAITTFLLASVGALLRWRIAVLRARAAAFRAPRPRPASARLAREWLVAAVAYRWTLARRDVGRSPPLSLRSMRPAAA
jgi:hypothetical protein